ncbi:MAG: DUF1835 domain-containing protein [Magnetovibrionaceae bacterium]
MTQDRIAHVRCGSDIREGLQLAGIDGDFIEASDPVCAGPLPSGLTGAPLRALRAAYLAEAWDGDETDYRSRLDEQDKALEGLETFDRIILWFEHDLYDQTILVRLLARLGRNPALKDRLALICIDRFPGLERFIGLGQLGPGQLQSLWGTEKPVTVEMIEQAAACWEAFRSPTPQGLMDLGSVDALPFAARAFARHLLEYPWETDGLGLTQRLSLLALARGMTSPGEVFGLMMRELEPLPWLGDLMFFGLLRGLAEAAHPAISPVKGPHDPISLTETGIALLKTEVDWISLNGLDAWFGGVHQQVRAGDGALERVWRWSQEVERLKPPS